jgi:hypothetical protein
MFMKVSNERRQDGCAAKHVEAFAAVRESDLSRSGCGPCRGRRMAHRLLDFRIKAGGFPHPPRSRCNHRNETALLTIQVPSIGSMTLAGCVATADANGGFHWPSWTL